MWEGPPGGWCWRSRVLLLPGLERLHVWETASSAIAIKGVWLEEQVLEKAQLPLQERDPE